MTYSPNLKLLTDWQSTVNVAFQQLRRILFVVEDDFKFRQWNPAISFGGMVASNFVLNYCRYCLINNTMFFSVNFQATLAAPFANQITLTLPESLVYLGATQAGGALIVNAGVAETGTWQLGQRLGFFRTGSANYTAGNFQAVANGVINLEA